MNKSRSLFCISALLACTAAAAEPPQGLQGRWTNGRISSIQYRDAYTGVGRPPTGKYFAYEFRADGTYTFSGMLQSTMYNCTTTMFGEESGTYDTTPSGDVALHPRKNPFRMTNTCAPNSNREGPGKLVERSFRYEIQGDRLELTGNGAPAQAFQRERIR